MKNFLLNSTKNNSQENGGDFLNANDFDRKKEYEKILEDLEIKENFLGKSEKRIILFSPLFNENGEKIDYEKIIEKLQKYLKQENLNLKFSYKTPQTSETGKILINSLKINTQILENGLSQTTEISNNISEKIKQTLKTEKETVKFLEETKNFYKKNLNNNTEIWVVNQDVIDPIIRTAENNLKIPKKQKIKAGEIQEYDIGKENFFIEKQNNFIYINFDNYEEIIKILKNSKNIPENIKKAINYFENGKIKIIDLQNVINKNILDNPDFLEQFKNSGNKILQKASFINILRKNNISDKNIEKLILRENLEKEILKIINYFEEIFFEEENIDFETLEEISFDLKKNKKLFFQFLKIISIINSIKITSFENIKKIKKIFEFFKKYDKKNSTKDYEKFLKTEIFEIITHPLIPSLSTNRGKIRKKIEKNFIKNPEIIQENPEITHKLIVIRHLELTENGKKIFEKKIRKLEKYLETNNKIKIYGAQKSQQNQDVPRIIETIKILKNILKKTEIIETPGLDSREKIPGGVETDIKTLKKQEEKTKKFIENFLENLENIYENEIIIFVVHRSNMHIISQLLDGKIYENPNYSRLDFGEILEYPIGKDENKKLKFLKKNPAFLYLDKNNYKEILDFLKTEKTTPEIIKNAIKNFENGKIDIIKLQNIINKSIKNNKNFIYNFKNSGNKILQKISFINILRDNNFFDAYIENLIITEKLEDKILYLINYFFPILENKISGEKLKIFEKINPDFSENKEILIKIFNALKIINSRKIISLENSYKLFKIQKIFDHKENFLDFSNVLEENLERFKNFFEVSENLEKQKFIFRIRLEDLSYRDFGIYLFYKENGIKKEHKINLLKEEQHKKQFQNLFENNPDFALLDKQFAHLDKPISEVMDKNIYFQIINFLENNYDFKYLESKDFGKTIIIDFEFKNGKLVKEKQEILSKFENPLNHNNLDLLTNFEDFLEKSIKQGFIGDEFLEILEKNKNDLKKYLESKIFYEILKTKRKLLNLIYNENCVLENNEAFIVTEKIENFSYEKILDENKKEKLKELKKDYIKKLKILNKLILKLEIKNDEIVKNATIEMIKELNNIFSSF